MDDLRCSFCHHSQGEVGRLMSNPSDYPRAYICDECIEACAEIVRVDRAEESGLSEEAQDPNGLLARPLAAELLGAVEKWIVRESLGAAVAEEFAAMREVAIRFAATDS